jgi:hypothetical protein
VKNPSGRKAKVGGLCQMETCVETSINGLLTWYEF